MRMRKQLGVFLETLKEMATGDECFPTFDQPCDFSDIILEVEGHLFHAHKVMLAKWSPVFKAMLDHSTARISLPENKVSDVLELLQVLYPPEKPIDSKNVMTILSLARQYQIGTITNRCEKFLLTTEPSLETVIIADEFQLKELATVTAQRVAKRSLKTQGIWDDTKFQQLRAETRLAIVEERIRNISVIGEKYRQAFIQLQENPILEQDCWCDHHRRHWFPWQCNPRPTTNSKHQMGQPLLAANECQTSFGVKTAPLSPFRIRISEENIQKRRESLEQCMHCSRQVSPTLKNLLLFSLQLKDDDFSI